MSDIWNLISEIGVELHPDRVKSIAAKIMEIDDIRAFEQTKFGIGSKTARDMIERLGNAWVNDPALSPKELAAGLIGASAAASMLEGRETVQMVWTGPTTSFVSSRRTDQVLLELIDSARSKLFMTSFVAYHIDSVMKGLEATAGKGVRVDILLELSKKEGGKVDYDSITAFHKSVPSANIYTWRPVTDPQGGWTGAVHAKCAVADGRMAFITSANLTSAALKRNMELGVLFRGGSIPDKLSRHLEALVTTGVIEPV